MDARLAELVRLLELERLEVNIFRGESRDIGSPQVFGGQVLGQSLEAAYTTVDEGRVVHSLHAYFLRRGDLNAPIVYFVDRSRDGHSFSSRRVTAIQHGEQIFHMAASFQVPQSGVEHSIAMPQVPPPEELPENIAPPASLNRLPEAMRQHFLRARPFEFRLARIAKGATPSQCIWLRAVDRLPDDDRLHRSLLAYVSDFNLLTTATLPYGGRELLCASIDHAMWFHRPVRIDEWQLYVLDSPSASQSRALVRGSLFTRDGVLVASTAQEGLMRVVGPQVLAVQQSAQLQPTPDGSSIGR